MLRFIYPNASMSVQFDRKFWRIKIKLDKREREFTVFGLRML